MPGTKWQAQQLKDFLRDSSLAEPERYLNFRHERAPAFFFKPSSRREFLSFFPDWDEATNSPVSLVNEIVKGNFRYFEHHTVKAGFPPDWHQNLFNGQKAPADLHWSNISDFGYGDIKCIWELSRFGFVYALVRAYWRTNDEAIPEYFWQLLEDWQANNPPQFGSNWKCGQEISFRVMAWCFGLYGFLESRASTPERVSRLAQMVAVSGKRIEGNVNYALSQRNNHGISEGAGLWTVGTLFPEFRDSERLEKKGRKILEELGQSLIYDDGSFVQHSVNYHRLMLHDYLWVLRLGDLVGRPFSSDLRERVHRAYLFLYQIHESENGGIPNYGQNDGALILPLNNCDYLDFRPVIQSLHYLFTDARCFKPGPWDEDLLWMFGPSSIQASVEAPTFEELNADDGGYYTLRSECSFVFTRCASFQDRPGQADMLHLDLWWRGQNIAVDPGTYSYNAEAPWDNALAHTAYHNTVTVDGLDQMDRIGKFLWFPWLKSRVNKQTRSKAGNLAYWEGEHDGYLRLKSPVLHRRAILRVGDGFWLILDLLEGSIEHQYRLHWLFPDFSNEWSPDSGDLKLITPEGSYYIQVATLAERERSSIIRADESTPRGWIAPYYNYREPAISLDLVDRDKVTLFSTIFGPERVDVSMSDGNMSLETTGWKASLWIQTNGAKTLIDAIHLSGDFTDRLEMI